MFETDKTARSAASYDWSASAVGDSAHWPLPLRVTADVLMNAPLPGLLVWGRQMVLLFNESYGLLAGPGYGRVPGGSVPPVMPPPLAAAGDALERAWSGEPLVLPDLALSFRHPQGTREERCDLRLTPVRGEDGQVAGVLLLLAPASPAAAAPDESGGTLRILVVEDNLDSQYLVCEMLRAFGHEADGVGHPDDALALLGRQRYDLLFSDVSLPGMSGVDLARRAVHDQPGLRVIFASGYGDTLLRHLEFPYLSLQKPYELDQLQEALATVAGAPAARA
ncbi:response regulator [Massilia sp. ST3]|uniref:response regulator n=1 Tax=Massilia sp. ST3 TaxID=2824903 RepID=UPI001E514A05|nr:response regulator [Massilia sp. ST3]